MNTHIYAIKHSHHCNNVSAWRCSQGHMSEQNIQELNLRLYRLTAAQSTSHMVALQMSSWAPPACIYSVSVCVCFRMCDYVVRISTSEDNVNESWLTLFPLAPSLFLSRGRQRKAKSCHPSHREVCRNKDSNSVCIFSTEFPRNAHLVAAIWNFDAFIFVI